MAECLEFRRVLFRSDGNPTGNVTYTWQHWADTNGNGIVDGAETATTVQTHVVSGGGTDTYIAGDADEGFKILVKADRKSTRLNSSHLGNSTSTFCLTINNVNPVGPVAMSSSFFFFNDTAATEIYTLCLHDALPIYTWQHWADTNGNGIVDGAETATTVQTHVVSGGGTDTYIAGDADEGFKILVK